MIQKETEISKGEKERFARPGALQGHPPAAAEWRYVRDESITARPVVSSVCEDVSPGGNGARGSLAGAFARRLSGRRRAHRLRRRVDDRRGPRVKAPV